MPFKDPEKRKKYQREYKRQQRAKAKEKLSIPCQTQAQETQIPRSLNWTKPYKRLGNYYIQDGCCLIVIAAGQLKGMKGNL
jgi:hypothetical protein